MSLQQQARQRTRSRPQPTTSTSAPPPLDPKPRTILTTLTEPVTDVILLTTSFLSSPTTHRALVRAFVFSAVLIASIGLAVVSYATFYWTYVPQLGVQRRVVLQYGFGRPPFATIDLGERGSLLKSEQAYDVTLDLVVPASERNMEIGNFMVTFTLKNDQHEDLLVSSQPATLSYESPLVRTLRTFLSLPSLLSFSRSQVQTLHIPLLRRELLASGRSSRFLPVSHLVPDDGGVRRAQDEAQAERRPRYAIVEVGRSDGYGGAIGDAAGFIGTRTGGEVQVYDAQIRIYAYLEGLRHIMYHHFYLSFLFFVSLFTLFELSSALLAWALVAYWRGTVAPFSSQDRSLPSKSPPQRSQVDYGDFYRQGQAQPRIVKREDDEQEQESSVSASREEESSEEQAADWERVKTDEEDEVDKETIGGSATTQGAAGRSMATFRSGTSVADSGSGTGSSVAGTARDARDDALRRRRTGE